MAPNEFRNSAKYSKAGVLDICGDHAIAYQGQGDAIARNDRIRDKILSACSSANLSPVVEKNFIPERQSRPRDSVVPTWKAGKRAAFVAFTSSLHSNSLLNAAAKEGYALDVADERNYCLHVDNCAKMGITFVPLAVEVLGGISEALKQLKRLAVLSDNRSFTAHGLSVAFCKLLQSLSISTIGGSAAMLLGSIVDYFAFWLLARSEGRLLDPFLSPSVSIVMVKGSASMVLSRSFWPDLITISE